MRLLNSLLIIFFCTCFFNCANDNPTQTSNNPTKTTKDKTNAQFRQIKVLISSIAWMN